MAPVKSICDFSKVPTGKVPCVTSRALVWVDGERVGYTPIRALELEPGTHRIKATVPGRPPKYQSVRVDPGGAHQVPFDF